MGLKVIDFVFIALLLLTVIIGLYKGFTGVILGCIVSIVISLLVSIFLSNIISSPIIAGDLGNQLRESLLDKLNAKNEIFTYALVMQDGVLMLDTGVQLITFAEGITGLFNISFLASIIAPAIEKIAMLLIGGNAEIAGTLGNAVAVLCTNYIIKIVVGIIIFIVLQIIFAVLRNGADNIKDNVVLRKIDRVFGAAVASVVFLSLIFIFLQITSTFVGEESSIMLTIKDSAIISKFAENNPFANVLTK